MVEQSTYDKITIPFKKKTGNANKNRLLSGLS